MKKSILVVAIILVLAGLTDVMAGLVTLTPDAFLQVSFYVSPPFNNTPDYIDLHLGYVNIPDPFTSMSGSLYNGETLLGTTTQTWFGTSTGVVHFGPALGWKSAESLFTFGDPTVVDFASIRDGSIQGGIDFSIETGSMIIDLEQVNLNMLHATDWNGGHPTSPGPVITSVSIIPEPGTVLLLGLGGLALRRKRRA